MHRQPDRTPVLQGKHYREGCVFTKYLLMDRGREREGGRLVLVQCVVVEVVGVAAVVVAHALPEHLARLGPVAAV